MTAADSMGIWDAASEADTAAAPEWVYTAEQLAAHPDAKMPTWAAFLAVQDQPVNHADPVGDFLAGQAERQAARDVESVA
jgi:hypothetical protein